MLLMIVSARTKARAAMTDPAAAIRRRTHRSAKDAGSRFERTIADWLARVLDDPRIDRQVRRGKDRGDISGICTLTGQRVVLELKDTATLSLGPWIREARVEAGNDDAPVAVVIHKRRGTADPAAQYVTMLTRDLAILLGADPEEDTP
jgi:hypothetical protein